ncbi:39891_t:CDS:2, partial [Gigaspora margarita]
IEIECSPREFIKQLLTTATRAEWTFNQGAYDEIHQKQVNQKNWKPFFALMKRHSKLQGKRLYQDVQYRKCKEEKKSFEYLFTCPYNKEAWAKKEEEIIDSIKEELKQKEKIDLGSNWLREVFIPRDKEEYKNWYIK